MAINTSKLNLGLTLPQYDQELENIGAQRVLLDLMQQPGAQDQALQQPTMFQQAPFDPSKYPELPQFTPFSQTEQGKNIIDELSQRRQQAVERQQEEMNAAKLQLQDYLSKEKSMDLLPIAALVDTWSGSNMAKYFKDEQDKNKELALALQQEVLKYGQAGVASESQALQDRLGLGSDESKQLQQLSQNKYEADLRAKAALDNAQLDARTKLQAAEEARKAARELEEYRWKMRKEIEAMKQRNKGSTEARQQRAEDRQVAFKLTDNENYKSENARLKLLGLLDEYEKAVQASGITVKPGEAKTKLNSIYQRFVSAQKEADNLGALTGSDLKIVWGQMPDATSLLYAGESWLGGAGEQGIYNAIQRARNEIERDHNISLEKLRTSFGGLSSDVDQRIDRFDKNFKRTYNKLQKPEDLPKVGTQAPETIPAKAPKSKTSQMTDEEVQKAWNKQFGGKK